VQDTLVRVAAQWGRLDDPAPYAYARTVLYHLAVDGWRRAWRRRERSTGELPEAAAPYDAALVPDRLALRTALAALPPRQRAVIVLRYYEDLGEAETAAALGCSVNTVKSHHRAALANLRRLAPNCSPRSRSTSGVGNRRLGRRTCPGPRGGRDEHPAAARTD
jgi:RNA polymerase sigma-70 factor (sigma-E family)